MPPRFAGRRTTRLTVNLSAELANRLRNTVYGLPRLTLSGLVAQAIASALSELEARHGGPFPKRAGELKSGRPCKSAISPIASEEVTVATGRPTARVAAGHQAIRYAGASNVEARNDPGTCL